MRIQGARSSISSTLPICALVPCNSIDTVPRTPAKPHALDKTFDDQMPARKFFLYLHDSTPAAHFIVLNRFRKSKSFLQKAAGSVETAAVRLCTFTL